MGIGIPTILNSHLSLAGQGHQLGTFKRGGFNLCDPQEMQQLRPSPRLAEYPKTLFFNPQVHTLKPQAYVFKPLERLLPSNSKKLRDPSLL